MAKILMLEQDPEALLDCPEELITNDDWSPARPVMFARCDVQIDWTDHRFEVPVRIAVDETKKGDGKS
jgi:hypothetical protein